MIIFFFLGVIMKKIILIISISILLTGCNKLNNYTYKDISIKDNSINNYLDDNPIKISLYQGSKKITNYNITLDNFKDIGVFSVYYTNKDALETSNTKYNFKKYYQEYSNIDNYKIGFYISFYVNDKHIEQLILDPTKTYAMSPYMYIYLYDDVNQLDGSFYSHLEPDDINDKTIYSSIKLFLPHNGIDITSNIILTAFTYKSDEDFTNNNHYRGKSSYTINIETSKT